MQTTTSMDTHNQVVQAEGQGEQRAGGAEGHYLFFDVHPKTCSTRDGHSRLIFCYFLKFMGVLP